MCSTWKNLHCSTKWLSVSLRWLKPDAGRCATRGRWRRGKWRAGLASPLPSGEIASILRAGERLSGESSCISVCGTRIACFCVEADEQFTRERNADDHFFLSFGNEPGAKIGEALVVARGDLSDQKQDRAHAAASAANRPLALSFATTVGDRSDADELGNGLVGVGADLRQVGH